MFSPIRLKSNKDISRNTFSSKETLATKKFLFETQTTEKTNSFFQTLETDLMITPQTTIHSNSVAWEKITPLINGLENQGQTLSRLPSLENFHRFRDLLQKIVHLIIPQALEIKKDFSLNPDSLTQKEFHLITGVNQELNSLLKMIKSNHKDHFKIANQVISIKGLIVDFYS